MASSSVKSFQVDIATNPSTIIVTAEPIATNVPETIPVAHITSVTPIFFDFSSPASPLTIAIGGYTTGPETITFPGNYGNDFTAGDTVVISGSTNNDGTYTVISAINSGANTVVTVLEVIDPAIVDGDITFTPNSGTVENNDSGDSFRETYPYKRMTRLVMELYEGRKLDLELQSITNQPTWSLGTKAALKTAALAINALL